VSRSLVFRNNRSNKQIHNSCKREVVYTNNTLPARKIGKTAIARAQEQEDLETLRPLGREWLNLIRSSVNLSEGGLKLIPCVIGRTP
jgi:hypothetical protein